MAKPFKDLKSLFAHIDRKAKQAIQQEDSVVKDVVVGELKKSIKQNVYEAYKSPAKDPYVRSKEHGGLTDSDNFVAEPTVDGIAIYSTRSGIDRDGNMAYIAEIIEGYKPYSVEDVWGYGYETPRHFVKPARDKIKNSRMLIKAMKLDLKNSGINAKLK